jgi:transposase
LTDSRLELHLGNPFIRALAIRPRIVLECASGVSNTAVAAKLRTTGFTVGLWRNRFITEGMVGLGDEMRPGAPRQIGDDRVERSVRLALEEGSRITTAIHRITAAES